MSATANRLCQPVIDAPTDALADGQLGLVNPRSDAERLEFVGELVRNPLSACA